MASIQRVTVLVFTQNTSILVKVNFFFRSLCNLCGKTVQLSDTSFVPLRKEHYAPSADMGIDILLGDCFLSGGKRLFAYRFVFSWSIFCVLATCYFILMWWTRCNVCTCMLICEKQSPWPLRVLATYEAKMSNLPQAFLCESISFKKWSFLWSVASIHKLPF